MVRENISKYTPRPVIEILCAPNLLSQEDLAEKNLSVDLERVKKLQEIKHNNPSISFSKTYDSLALYKTISNHMLTSKDNILNKLPEPARKQVFKYLDKKHSLLSDLDRKEIYDASSALQKEIIESKKTETPSKGKRKFVDKLMEEPSKKSKTNLER